MISTATKAVLLRSLHIPGDPLIVVNVWDAVSAMVVASVSGVKALARASHSISDAHGVKDGGGLGPQGAVDAARVIIEAVELPVTVDFEKGYGDDADAVGRSVTRLIGAGAAGLNIEDSVGHISDGQYDIRTAADRVKSARAAAEKVSRAVAEIDGPVSVIAGPASVPLARLAELGVCRVSFSGRPLALAMAHLHTAATQLTVLGDYPPELGFRYSSPGIVQA